MLEKLKDLCYDLSDVLLSLLIIALIFFVVSWKISDSLNFKAVPNNPNSTNTNIVNTNETIDIKPPATTENINISNSKTETESTLQSDDTKDSTTNVSDGSNETSIDSQTPAAKPSANGGTQTITISSGATGASIAKQLQDAGLIDSTSKFIGRLGERKLDSKLQTGTFRLSNNMSMDEIINKLTGQ